MNNSVDLDRIIATDYFDGPLEGFAKISSMFFYFCKQAATETADVESYLCCPIDYQLFFELERAVDAVSSTSRVFVYSGADEDANRMVDRALRTFRAAAHEEGRVVTGHDLFDAMGSNGASVSSG